MPRPDITTGRVVTVSFLVDLLDIATNLVVALLTGSAVVFAEMAQGAADSVGSFLLIVGHRRSRRSGTRVYPLGYAREVFFWALLSSMTMLTLGSGVTFLRAFRQITDPQPLEHPLLALGVMLLSVTTNGYALSQSIRKLRPTSGSFLGAFRDSSQQLVKTALLRDLLGSSSAVAGLIAVSLYLTADLVLFDALGALLIGALMLGFAALLISECRSYITGRSASPGVQRAILEVANEVPEVQAVNELVAVIAGSEEITVELNLDLADDLTTTAIEGVLDRLEEAIKDAVPSVTRVRVDLNPGVPPSQGDEST